MVSAKITDFGNLAVDGEIIALEVAGQNVWDHGFAETEPFEIEDLGDNRFNVFLNTNIPGGKGELVPSRRFLGIATGSDPE